MSGPRDGGPAFPESYVGADRPHEGIGDGMSLRDYFAAKAMQSICAGPGYLDSILGEINAEEIAAQAYLLADAMLLAREHLARYVKRLNARRVRAAAAIGDTPPLAATKETP